MVFIHLALCLRKLSLEHEFLSIALLLLNKVKI